MELTTTDGWAVQAVAEGGVQVGDAVEGFVRPEVASLGRNEAGAPSGTAARTAGVVESLLFDGANSAVLLKEERTTRASFASPCLKPAGSPT